MSAGHTPGPWIVCVQDGDPWGAHTVFAEDQLENGVISADGWDWQIASACVNHENFEANARLIASAPDLLAERNRLKAANAELADTLDEFLAAFDGVIAQGGISLSVDDRSSGWVSRARAALAKHKGETA